VRLGHKLRSACSRQLHFIWSEEFVTRIEFRHLAWRKALRSMNAGDCVEIAPADGKIFVRDSMNPDGPVLEYSTSAWRGFLNEAKQGSIV